jgi:hypothetical protein
MAVAVAACGGGSVAPGHGGENPHEASFWMQAEDRINGRWYDDFYS